MQELQINQTTYRIQRVFTGSRTSADLVAQRLKESSRQVLPLTALAPISYNTGGNPSVVRSVE